jgi:hypothetical protein
MIKAAINPFGVFKTLCTYTSVSANALRQWDGEALRVLNYKKTSL